MKIIKAAYYRYYISHFLLSTSNRSFCYNRSRREISHYKVMSSFTVFELPRLSKVAKLDL